jgi:hypothetical protein
MSSRLLDRSALKDSKKIYFAFFWSFYKCMRTLEVWLIFWKFKMNNDFGKELKGWWANFGPRPRRTQTSSWPERPCGSGTVPSPAAELVDAGPRWQLDSARAGIVTRPTTNMVSPPPGGSPVTHARWDLHIKHQGGEADLPSNVIGTETRQWGGVACDGGWWWRPAWRRPGAILLTREAPLRNTAARQRGSQGKGGSDRSAHGEVVEAADVDAWCGCSDRRSWRRRGHRGSPHAVTLWGSEIGARSSPEAADFEGAALAALFNADGKKWKSDELSGSWGTRCSRGVARGLRASVWPASWGRGVIRCGSPLMSPRGGGGWIGNSEI